MTKAKGRKPITKAKAKGRKPITKAKAKGVVICEGNTVDKVKRAYTPRTINRKPKELAYFNNLYKTSHFKGLDRTRKELHLICRCNARIFNHKKRVANFLRNHENCEPAEDGIVPKPSRAYTIDHYNNKYEGSNFIKLEGAGKKRKLICKCGSCYMARYVSKLGDWVKNHDCNDTTQITQNETENKIDLEEPASMIHDKTSDDKTHIDTKSTDHATTQMNYNNQQQTTKTPTKVKANTPSSSGSAKVIANLGSEFKKGFLSIYNSVSQKLMGSSTIQTSIVPYKKRESYKFLERSNWDFTGILWKDNTCYIECVVNLMFFLMHSLDDQNRLKLCQFLHPLSVVRNKYCKQEVNNGTLNSYRNDMMQLFFKNENGTLKFDHPDGKALREYDNIHRTWVHIMEKQSNPETHHVVKLKYLVEPKSKADSYALTLSLDPTVNNSLANVLLNQPKERCYKDQIIGLPPVLSIHLAVALEHMDAIFKDEQIEESLEIIIDSKKYIYDLVGGIYYNEGHFINAFKDMRSEDNTNYYKYDSMGNKCIKIKTKCFPERFQFDDGGGVYYIHRLVYGLKRIEDCDRFDPPESYLKKGKIEVIDVTTPKIQPKHSVIDLITPKIQPKHSVNDLAALDTEAEGNAEEAIVKEETAAALLQNRRQNIKAIESNLPKHGGHYLAKNVFGVNDTLEKYLKALKEDKVNTFLSQWLETDDGKRLSEDDKRDLKSSFSQGRQLANNSAKITNYVGKKGARYMIDSTYMMKSKYGFLDSMKLILEFLETLTWQDENNVENNYALQYNYIYNEGKSIAQKAHTDYKKNNGINDAKKALPFTVFFGVSEESKLIIWNGERFETIKYGLGDVLFLAGDVVHAGPTYDDSHSRIQMYADTNVKHNYNNPNEWSSEVFNKQPLAYELDQGIHTAESFNDDIDKAAFIKTYGVLKEDIIKQLLYNEKNPNNKKKFYY